MGKYGDLDGSGVVTPSDVNAIFDMLVGNVALPDNEIGDFFKLNMLKKWAFTGPSFIDMVKMNQLVATPGDQEDFWDADYDNAWDTELSGKGSYVDMDATKFVASFPTLMDFASWSGPAPIPGQNEDFRETGWGRLYSKSGTYQTESGLVPPTELYKTKTFEKSDFGLHSLAFDGDYAAISAYMYGAGTAAPNVGSVFVYHKLPNGSYVFRHEIEVSGTSRSPIAEIHGDWLFVGNPIAHKIDIYSLAELDSNQKFYAKNDTSPKQTFYAPVTIAGQPDTDWYGTHLHCSDGEQLFVGVENGRLEIPATLTEPAYTVDCGYVDVYNLVDGVWTYLTRITPPDLSIFQNENTYGNDPSDINFGSVVYHRKDTVSGDEYAAIGAPRASTSTARYPGSVYIFKKVLVNTNVTFQFVHKEDYQDSWFGSSSTDPGEFEFGRSVILTEDLSLFVASNPISGSHVTRVPKNELVADTWKTDSATHTLISSDRIGGTLATNGSDVVYGGPNKLRVFQAITVSNPEVLPKPEGPQETTSVRPEYIEKPRVPEEPQIEATEQPETKLNKPLPREWGAPPSRETKDAVSLPFGYGMGPSTLADWIEDNSTGDARGSSYLRKLVDADKSTGTPDYYELWEHGNPAIRVVISSDIGGSVTATTPHGTILVKKNRVLKYKSATRSTITLATVGDLTGVAVYWSVNGKQMVGNTRLELLVCGEDMDVEVNFSKDKYAENDTPTMCAMTRSGVTKLFNKNKS